MYFFFVVQLMTYKLSIIRNRFMFERWSLYSVVFVFLSVQRYFSLFFLFFTDQNLVSVEPPSTRSTVWYTTRDRSDGGLFRIRCVSTLLLGTFFLSRIYLLDLAISTQLDVFNVSTISSGSWRSGWVGEWVDGGNLGGCVN